MVQIENEYGEFYACDHQYMIWLRDLYQSYIKSKAVLYTSDNLNSSCELESPYSLYCGSVPDVFVTVNFDSWTKNITPCFQQTRGILQQGPPAVSELYAGLPGHWRLSTEVHNISHIFIKNMKYMLALNASINIYMFHGGTNFGFTAGSYTFNDDKFAPVETSYDFSAPLNEAGDPTEMYFEIKKLLKENNFVVPNDTSPIPASKGDYGTFTMQPLVSLFDKVTQRIKPIESDVPLGFEIMGINSGFVMYETILTNDQKEVTTPVNLTISTIRDQATIFLDQIKVIIIPRNYENIPVSLYINSKVQKLSILIENQGRLMNYGNALEDKKGIFEPVKLGNHILGPWKMIAYPLNETSWFSTIEPRKSVVLPAFYKTTFTLPENLTKPLDTYLDPTGWKKGVAFVNGINIGRYWPSVGPQITLYIPALFLIPYPGLNNIIMLELEGIPEKLSISLVDKPNIYGKISKGY